ncbi:hypothetical protein AYP84_00950 [Lactobacillus crispatus]|nr:DUF771 domain-containing protein [Lactobacillus crispatus]OXC15486.1 hypothetical protein AYP78_04395 [Lactobacillus crispatus]OXC16699.1 hypothetical protein AYP79_08735 [Lactobacillus crispatus]OXC16991.1 hypothetical protein AYP80_03280 [Lactobacillus crispatus]OXC26289.1 hypothetical protein AYP84_00950 [Lactobacillus crispatus]
MNEVNAMDTLINMSYLKDLVQDTVNEALKKKKDDLTGKTWNIDEFRKNCCRGKGDNWVRTFIFDEFPEVNYKKGGFVVNPRKTPEGKTTIIFAKEACEWMQKHQHEIDWNAKITS